jgi:hypothetical protein
VQAGVDVVDSGGGEAFLAVLLAAAPGEDLHRSCGDAHPAIADTFDRKEALGKAMADYDLIFAKQMAAGDLRGARATLDKLVDLLDLGSAIKVQAASEPLEIIVTYEHHELPR